MARAFMGLLRGLGHDVTTACHLRTFDRDGDAHRQQRLQSMGRRAADILLRQYARSPERRPDLWFTYHAYHKAPDLLGAAIAHASAIPYVVAEASIAGKQADGPSARGHAQTVHAVSEATAVLAMTRQDEEGLAPFVPPHRLHHFPPFVSLDERPADRGPARRELARDFGLDAGSAWMITVAMMRDDVKKTSYRLLARSLQQVRRRNWHLLVAGDGIARETIERAFAPVRSRVTFLGELPRPALSHLHAAADFMVWPALREAYGMALLEAQAAGLPVVACSDGGVVDIVRHGTTGLLVDRPAARPLAAAVDRLIADVGLRATMARNAAQIAREVHGEPVARARLARILETCTCA